MTDAKKYWFCIGLALALIIVFFLGVSMSQLVRGALWAYFEWSLVLRVIMEILAHLGWFFLLTFLIVRRLDDD